ITGRWILFEETHMIDHASLDTMLRRVDVLSREVEQLRRDLLRGVAAQPATLQPKPSLFGSVRAGDITAEMIDEAQRDLFRSLEDL
ncbi:MAG: hypothetical protein KDH90_06185, partial [Anaerolineae bacterium]|nr:hypothetical protein [Anaerolineae bacterium]